MTTQTITIEKNIPLPERVWGAHGRPSKYPFAQMEVGDSFAITAIEQPAEKLRNNIGNCAIKWTQKNAPERKFSTRVTGGTVRIWRTA